MYHTGCEYKIQIHIFLKQPVCNIGMKKFATQPKNAGRKGVCVLAPKILQKGRCHALCDAHAHNAHNAMESGWQRTNTGALLCNIQGVYGFVQWICRTNILMKRWMIKICALYASHFCKTTIPVKRSSIHS